MHEGRGSLADHLVEFRKCIFEGLTFSLDGMQNDNQSDETETNHVAGLKDHLAELIEIMGGKVAPNRSFAKVWLFYKDNEFA